ncbi:MAG: hypothetical protein IKU25_01495 [Clostridia bacterium]|nr:hypothetical protein [Clostridia bacterium]
MKFCTHCGAQIHEEAVICVKCGCSVAPPKPVVNNSDDNVMQLIVKIFLILGCVACGWLIIPLAWCLPITIAIFNRMRDNKPISTGLKVCALIFVNLIAGICLLCMDDENKINI